jgi:hypothetical protein
MVMKIWISLGNRFFGGHEIFWVPCCVFGNFCFDVRGVMLVENHRFGKIEYLMMVCVCYAMFSFHSYASSYHLPGSCALPQGVRVRFVALSTTPYPPVLIHRHVSSTRSCIRACGPRRPPVSPLSRVRVVP